jgi:hypothetical protein
MKPIPVRWRRSGAGMGLSMRSNNTCLLMGAAASVLVGLCLSNIAARGEGGAAKAIFEKYNLFGTFAWDCSKPPSAKDNWYYVHRLIDPDHVQRDLMTGATTRQWLAVIDKVVELSPNELEVSGTITGRVRGRDVDRAPGNGKWRVAPGRLLQWETTMEGEKLIADGRLVNTGFQLPWSNRCGG